MKNGASQKTIMKVIGVGGAGCNAVTRMFTRGIRGVELIAANTDVQDLRKTRAHVKVKLGGILTRGLGTGMDPQLGREAAKESSKEITHVLAGTNLLFLTAGFGGGTGTGALPIIAELAKNLGILTVAVVTRPFSFEGQERFRICQAGIAELQEKVDTILPISNDKIFEVCEPNTPLREAFARIDEVLQQAVRGIADLIAIPGFVNVDFADVKNIMKHGGRAVFGVGLAGGEKRAKEATEAALYSPFLDFSLEGSKGIVVNIAASDDVSLAEVEEAIGIILKKADRKAKIIFGAMRDPALQKGFMKITVIATGIPEE
jgi:cell division protein FtsZ